MMAADTVMVKADLRWLNMVSSAQPETEEFTSMKKKKKKKKKHKHDDTEAEAHVGEQENMQGLSESGTESDYTPRKKKQKKKHRNKEKLVTVEEGSDEEQVSASIKQHSSECGTDSDLSPRKKKQKKKAVSSELSGDDDGMPHKKRRKEKIDSPEVNGDSDASPRKKKKKEKRRDQDHALPDSSVSTHNKDLDELSDYVDFINHPVSKSETHVEEDSEMGEEKEPQTPAWHQISGYVYNSESSTDEDSTKDVKRTIEEEIKNGEDDKSTPIWQQNSGRDSDSSSVVEDSEEDVEKSEKEKFKSGDEYSDTQCLQRSVYDFHSGSSANEDSEGSINKNKKTNVKKSNNSKRREIRKSVSQQNISDEDLSSNDGRGSGPGSPEDENSDEEKHISSDDEECENVIRELESVTHNHGDKLGCTKADIYVSDAVSEIIHPENSTRGDFGQRMNEELLEKGFELRSCRFIHQEDLILKRNWKQFIKNYPVNQPLSLFETPHSKELKRVIVKFRFFLCLSKNLNRSVRSCFNRARTILYYKTLTKEDKEEGSKRVYKLYRLHGPKWKKISQETGLSEAIVRRMFRGKDKKYGKGEWSSQEEEALKRAIMKVTGIKDEENLPRENLPWSRISERVKTRSETQCRRHWLFAYRWKHPSQEKKSKWHTSDWFSFLQQVRDSGATEECEIPWNDIVKGFPEAFSVPFLKEKWNIFKVKIPDHKLYTFTRLTKLLTDKYIDRMLSEKGKGKVKEKQGKGKVKEKHGKGKVKVKTSGIKKKTKKTESEEDDSPKTKKTESVKDNSPS